MPGKPAAQRKSLGFTKSRHSGPALINLLNLELSASRVLAKLATGDLKGCTGTEVWSLLAGNIICSGDAVVCSGNEIVYI